MLAAGFGLINSLQHLDGPDGNFAMGWPLAFARFTPEHVYFRSEPLAALLNLIVALDALFLTGCFLERRIRHSRLLWAIFSMSVFLAVACTVLILCCSGAL